MGGRSSSSNISGRSYESYPTTGTDTLIVERNGRYQIEPYAGQNLDEYDYVAEMNHSRILDNKYQQDNGAYYMQNISLNDIFNYLRRQFNFKG